jgi:hypothetical protein
LIERLFLGVFRFAKMALPSFLAEAIALPVSL